MSGKIVFLDVGNGRSFSADSIAERQSLAVRYASEAGAEAILIEGRFAESDPGIPKLRDAIVASQSPVTVGWPLAYSTDESSLGMRVDRRAAFPGAAETAQVERILMTGFIPYGESPVNYGGQRYNEFSAAIAGIDHAPGSFLIDYRYRVQDIPVLSLADLEERPSLRKLMRDKRVVIGSSIGALERTALVPGQWYWVPSTFVEIIAAETLRQGPPLEVPGLVIFFATVVLLYIAAILPKSSRRRLYAAGGVLIVAVPLILAPFGPIMMMGTGVTVMLVYFALRFRSHQRERAAGIERISGLPNFHALEDDYSAARGRLIIAKVDNFEEIMASLEPARHASFVHHIAQRLSIGGSARIYTDATGHFAWFDDLEHAKSHVAGLLALTSAPIVIGDRTLDFNCSFGLLDCHIEKPRQAISATVVAASRAAARPAHVSYVSEQEDFDANWQLSLLASLEEAISKEQIYLVFQPQRSLADNRIVGVEALVRWRHPERGVISPSQFIPQIEQAGRLKPLTAHTLRLAARASEHTVPSGIRVSVNVSAALVGNDDFPKFVDENIRAGGGRSSAITIEITETARIPDIDRAARNLETLRKMGYHIALDDFGTGEANLSLLVALPCDEVKIDRTFVVLAQHSDRARMVISALCHTAQLSNMRLVAEGIETEQDLMTLRNLGCEFGQGYLLGKPQMLMQFLQALESRPRKRGRN